MMELVFSFTIFRRLFAYDVEIFQDGFSLSCIIFLKISHFKQTPVFDVSKSVLYSKFILDEYKPGKIRVPIVCSSEIFDTPELVRSLGVTIKKYRIVTLLLVI